MKTDNVERVLEFWFGKLTGPSDLATNRSRLWFKKSDDTDEMIRQEFGPLVERAACEDWALTPKNAKQRLATIILLDQFTRNIYRDQAQAYSADGRALQLSLDGIAQREDKTLLPIQRVFFYLPLEHSEDKDMQQMAVNQFQGLLDEAPPTTREAFENYLEYARRHKAIVDRFGRFPHRNKILGRHSTAEEIEFLKEPGSSF